MLKLKSLFEKLIFSWPAYGLCALLLFPLALYGFRLGALSWPEGSKAFVVFCLTVFQAGASSILSLFFAVLGSRGLLSLAKKKYYFLIEGFVVLPCLIPPLIFCLSLVHLVDQFRSFPFGLPALILAQTISWTGLCAVALTRALLKEAGSLSEWMCLYSRSSWIFIPALLKTVLRKDVKTLFALVFVSCFASLSLPLLISGSSDFSLEFFIYENLKNPKLWPEALALILFQSFFAFWLCWRAFSKSSPSSSYPIKKIYLWPQPFWVFIPLLAGFFSVGGLFFISDLKVFFQLFPLWPLILSASLNSLILSLGAGVLTLLAFVVLSFSFQNTRARKFIASFVPPGVSFMGFAFLLIPFYSEKAVLIKWMAGLSLLIFPWVYRFRGEQALDKLSDQAKTARFLGASWQLVFRDIIWPQSRSLFFLCAGLASFWACGDFAYSLIVSTGHWNLSLLVYDLFSSYKLNSAVLLSWLWLALSFFVFLFWRGLDYFLDKKVFP